MHGAQGYNIFVGAAVAHDAHALDREEDGEGLAGEVVPGLAAGTVGEVAQLFDEDGVGFAQQVGVFLFHLAEDAHAQTGAGEGVAIDHFGRQAESHAQFAHFVLEEVAQRFEQFEAELFGQAADVVVALDGDGLLAFAAPGFDHVRVNGALCEKGGALVATVASLQLGSFGLEDLDEFAADDLALVLGVAHAGELAQKLLAGIDMNDVGVQLAGEHLDNHLAFILAQQAMVDENAGELIANGAMDERRGDRGIDTAGQAEDDFLAAHLFADAGDGLVDVVAHDPIRLRAANVEHKAIEDGPALHGVRDFGVELHAVEAARFVGHAGNRAGRGAGHELEARRQLGERVAVAHPHLEHAVAFSGAEILDALQQFRMAARAHFGVAEFA